MTFQAYIRRIVVQENGAQHPESPSFYRMVAQKGVILPLCLLACLGLALVMRENVVSGGYRVLQGASLLEGPSWTVRQSVAGVGQLSEVSSQVTDSSPDSANRVASGWTGSPAPAPSGSLEVGEQLPSRTAGQAPCFECDMKHLRAGLEYQLLGCPQFPHMLNPLVLYPLMRNGPTWIAYVGDSLLRGVFFPIPSVIKGPQWRQAERSNHSLYHNDQMFCCRDVSDLDTCSYRCQGLHFMQPVHEEVQRFLGAGDSARAVCFSFAWVPVLNNTEISNYMRAPLRPKLVVLNQGLHHLAHGWPTQQHYSEWTTVFRSIMSWNRESKKTLFVVHNMAYLHEEFLSKEHLKRFPLERLSKVQKYNHILGDAAHDVGMDALLKSGVRFFDAYRLTKMGDVVPRTDGKHYDGGYQAIAVNVHLNFLLLQGEALGFCTPITGFTMVTPAPTPAPMG